jgi:MCP family monocarboxylic acid transporter-like MFS transporter 10
LSGAGVGTLALSPVVEFLLERYNWRSVMQILSGLASVQFICSFIQYFIEPPRKVKNDFDEEKRVRKRKFINLSLFKNKAYVVWIVVVSLVLFGFYIPYVHLVRKLFYSFSREYEIHG